MRTTRFIPAFTGVVLAMLLCAPARSQPPAPRPPRPGSVNYIEGQASIGSARLDPSAVGTLELGRNQSLSTESGKVEMLLTPGVFLRLADNSSVKMISPDLANTEAQLERGRAMVEVVDIRKENDIRIDVNGASAKLLHKGLYDFDADRHEVRVFNGSMQVSAGGQKTKLGSHRQVTLGGSSLKATRFESRQYEDEFYRWCGLRSGYLSEASVDAASTYLGSGPGWYGPGWTGFGWYWDPWFSVYTYLPANGVYWGPFGWGFYSPIRVYRSPFMFYGRYPHHFGDYHYPYGHGYPRPGRGGRRR